MNDPIELEYGGFWARVGASLIDSVLIMVVLMPLARVFYGGGSFSYDLDLSTQAPGDFWLSLVLPAVVVLVFWSSKHATPGKMAIGAKIVDAKTGGAPTFGQHLIRYVGYFVSTLFFCLGFLWIAFDAKKQGCHDTMAGTVVVRPKNRGREPVRFEP
jgi:uncharacterized RDD family membrane protein YckC